MATDPLAPRQRHARPTVPRVLARAGKCSMGAVLLGALAASSGLAAPSAVLRAGLVFVPILLCLPFVCLVLTFHEMLHEFEEAYAADHCLFRHSD